MKKLNLNIDYKLESKNQDGVEYSIEEMTQANAELTSNYIETAVMMAHRDGLNSQFRRLWVKTQSKIKTAISLKDYEVEFEDGEFNFIKDAFASDNCKFNSHLAHYVVALEDEILSV